MKYLTAQLNKTLQNRKGFTLIELMVVITIIAVLAVIGVIVYSRAQGSARDAARRSDVKNLITVFETKKAPSASNYGGITTATGDFGSGAFPADPTSTRVYCVSPTGTNTTPGTQPTTTDWAGTCPTNYVSINGAAYTSPTGATKITVCAWLEQESRAFCLSTSQ